MDADWTVLDLDRDPTPGDPEPIGELAAQLLRRAEQERQRTDRLRAIAGSAGRLRLRGDYAAGYQEALTRLVGDSAALGSAQLDCGRALAAYAERLREAKTLSAAALSRGTEADAQYRQVLNQVCAVLRLSVEPGPVWRELNGAEAARRSIGFDPPIREYAIERGQYAAMFEDERRRAGQLAIQAAQVREAAEAACVQAIRAATVELSSSRSWREGDPAPSPRAGDTLPTDATLNDDFRGEDDPTNDDRFFFPDTVEYMSPEQREQCRLFVDGDGRLRRAGDGTLFDTSGATTQVDGRGRAIFVMDGRGNLYAANQHEIGKTHHSSLLAGAPVAGAGEIVVDNGVLVAMTDRSGHYWPQPGTNDRALLSLIDQGLRPSDDFKQYDRYGAER